MNEATGKKKLIAMKYLSASSSSSLLIWYTHSVLENGWIYFRCSIQCTIFLGCHPRPEARYLPGKKEFNNSCRMWFRWHFCTYDIYIYIGIAMVSNSLCVQRNIIWLSASCIESNISRCTAVYLCIYIYIYESDIFDGFLFEVCLGLMMANIACVTQT